MEIIAFTFGDSNKLKTWSNVPYLFLKHLEASGNVKVHRVNIRLEDSNIFLKIIVAVLNRIMMKLGGEFNSFIRTPLYDYFVQKRMQKALEQYPDSDILLTLNFNHILKGTGKKTVLFSDWTIQYGIEEGGNRTPTKAEWKAIERQNATIAAADYVVTFFPNIYEYMRERHGDTVHYIGNFINAIEEANVDAKKKYDSNIVLFVGRPNYIQALLPLVEAIELYNRHNKLGPLELHVIGMDQTKVPKKDFVYCYGYLDKSIQAQREKYYSLMKRAKVMVNTHELWVAASSVIEGLYFGTPVIIYPNKNLVKTFGEDISFGYYCGENTAEAIFSYLEELNSLDFESYAAFCEKAEEAVAEFTWPSYIKRLRALLDF